jgi:hypothetical protein
LRLALEGSLTPAGMSAERFDRWVSDSFDIQVVASEARAA